MRFKRFIAAVLLILVAVLPGCSKKDEPPKGTVPTSITYEHLGKYELSKKLQRSIKALEEGAVESEPEDVRVYADLVDQKIQFNTTDPYHPFGDMDLTGYDMKSEDPPIIYYLDHTLRAYLYTRKIGGLTTDEAVRIYTNADNIVLRYETVNYRRYADLLESTGDSEENVRLRREAMIRSLREKSERLKGYELVVDTDKSTSYTRQNDRFFMDTNGHAVIQMQITLRRSDDDLFPASYSLVFYGVYDPKK